MEGTIRFAIDEFPPLDMVCLRCGAAAPMRFAGPCARCTAELRETMVAEAREIEGGEYVPKVNVTPNAVALKEV